MGAWQSSLETSWLQQLRLHASCHLTCAVSRRGAHPHRVALLVQPTASLCTLHSAALLPVGGTL